MCDLRRNMVVPHSTKVGCHPEVVGTDDDASALRLRGPVHGILKASASFIGYVTTVAALFANISQHHVNDLANLGSARRRMAL